jgi:hypothetical protein
MLGQINARGLVSQVVVQDSLLFVACGSWGAQIYSVSDPANPRDLGSMDAVIGDVCVEDSFCYAVGGDSLRIYNVARPNLPSLAGAIRDSGDLVVVANGYAFSAGRWVMNIYNVTDPAHPTWANSRGGPAYAMFVRRNLLFCSSVQPDNMTVLNISDPLNIAQVSKVDGYGGDGLFVDDSYAYLPCDYEHSGLFVIDVSDSSHPMLRDSINPEGVTEWEPYVPSPNSYGYLADDYGGLITLDLHDANSIFQAWAGYQAHQANDVVVDGQRAYLADYCAGLQILDVSDPAKPVSLGRFDTLGSKATRTATARDSFAFIGMDGITGRQFLRVLDVLEPRDGASPGSGSHERDRTRLDRQCGTKLVPAPVRLYVVGRLRHAGRMEYGQYSGPARYPGTVSRRSRHGERSCPCRHGHPRPDSADRARQPATARTVRQRHGRDNRMGLRLDSSYW